MHSRGSAITDIGKSGSSVVERSVCRRTAVPLTAVSQKVREAARRRCCQKWVPLEVGVARERERVVSLGTRRGCCKRWCRQGTKRRCHHKVVSPGEGGVVSSLDASVARRLCLQGIRRGCCQGVAKIGCCQGLTGGRRHQKWLSAGDDKRVLADGRSMHRGAGTPYHVTR